MADGKDQIGNFASTGGWKVGTKPPTELYASSRIISLTEAQQARMMEVATSVYRLAATTLLISPTATWDGHAGC